MNYFTKLIERLGMKKGPEETQPEAPATVHLLESVKAPEDAPANASPGDTQAAGTTVDG